MLPTSKITGQDAVVCLIGHVRGSPANVQTDAIKNIIAVMEKSGPKRLISLTGTGVRLPSDKFRLIDHLMNAAIKLADISRITDGINHVHIIQKSNLSWTVIRVLKLTNSRPRKYKLLPHGPTKILIPRAEVAQAILECLEQNSFVKKAPIIG
jgi:putative NADH-flavin reductase